MKHLKKTILLLTVVLGLGMQVQAQTPNNKRERIERIKSKFISQKLNLDAKTAEAFWPIYNEYDNAKQQLYRQFKRSKKVTGVSILDIESRLERDQEMLNLRKKYTVRFSKILSPSQLANLRKAENEFRRMIIQKVKGGKEKYYKNKSNTRGAA